MSTDRELVESAAKAVGIQGNPAHNETTGEWSMTKADGAAWRPLADDGDALRLAVAAGLTVMPFPLYAKPKMAALVTVKRDENRLVHRPPVEVFESYGTDPGAATRRAIVRAAAQVGQEGVL